MDTDDGGARRPERLTDAWDKIGVIVLGAAVGRSRNRVAPSSWQMTLFTVMIRNAAPRDPVDRGPYTSKSSVAVRM
jgi:hypothetical protein